MSQEELAFQAGMDRTYLSGIETGRRNPTLDSIFKIATALGLSVGVLVQLAERSESDAIKGEAS